MISRIPENPPNQQSPRWPISQMLRRGTFATGTAAEKRLVLRNRIVCGVLLVWALISRFVMHTHISPVMREIPLFLPAVLCTHYALEKRKYFLSLDELTRRIELEGMAWAYSLGVLAALWVGGIGYVASRHYALDPKLLSWAPFFLLALFLAMVKGAYRYVATRRY